MKLTLTGPHCCGKSTVFKMVENTELSKKLRFIHYDGSRAPIDYGNVLYLKEHPDAEIDLTHWMIADLIKREVEVTQKEPRIILDRCVIDQLVYPFVILGSERFPTEIEEYARYWVTQRPYDVVFLFPRNEELLERFGKNKDIGFLNAVDEAYVMLLDKYGVNYIQLPNDQESQVRVIKSELEELLR